MAVRPRVNLDSSYFLDSYISEQRVIDEKILLYSEVVSLLKSTEKDEND